MTTTEYKPLIKAIADRAKAVSCGDNDLVAYYDMFMPATRRAALAWAAATRHGIVGVELRNGFPSDDDRWAVVLPDPSSGFRTCYFTASGFHGYEKLETAGDALEKALEYDYTVIDRGALSRLGLSKSLNF